MSEYWISKKKYFCKYCEIYIADDVPSRQHHENGLRHKGNRERFIRGLYKEGEKRKKDSEEEKREMARVELAAQAAYSQDISAGRAEASSSSVPASTSSQPARKAPSKPSNPFANYSTAASLGFTDPDVERAASEAALHQSQGVVGEWQVVETKTVPAPTSMEEGDAVTPLISASDDGGQSMKRPADQQPDHARDFKLRKKMLETGLGQIYDPGMIKFKPKKKEGVKKEMESVPTAAPEKPKWSAVQWKRPVDVSSTPMNDDATPGSTDNEIATSENGVFVSKSEDDDKVSPEPQATELKPEPVVTDKILPNVKAEEKEAALSPSALAEPGRSLFRKRKVALGSGSRVKREL